MCLAAEILPFLLSILFLICLFHSVPDSLDVLYRNILELIFSLFNVSISSSFSSVSVILSFISCILLVILLSLVLLEYLYFPCPEFHQFLFFLMILFPCSGLEHFYLFFSTVPLSFFKGFIHYF